VLAGLEGALRSEASAEKIVGMLYAENVIVTEEPPALNEGAHGFLDYLGSNSGKGCKYSLKEPIVASNSTFSSYLAPNCAADPPTMKKDLDLRLLYVWKKLAQDWRVVLETVQTGKL